MLVLCCLPKWHSGSVMDAYSNVVVSVDLPLSCGCGTLVVMEMLQSLGKRMQ